VILDGNGVADANHRQSTSHQLTKSRNDDPRSDGRASLNCRRAYAALQKITVR
jgi:hypothetical protein